VVGMLGDDAFGEGWHIRERERIRD
jgi:hypothetical protein